MRLVNLCPHPITFRLPDGTDLVFPAAVPKGEEARVDSFAEDRAPIILADGTELATFEAWDGEVYNLPEPEYEPTLWDGYSEPPGGYDPTPILIPRVNPSVGYIVSGKTLATLRKAGSDRCDIFAPGTGPKDGAIRYADGPRKGLVEAVVKLDRLGGGKL